MKYSSIEGLTFTCLRYSIFTIQILETKLQSNKETRAESYGATQKVAKKLENKVMENQSSKVTKKLENKVTEK